MRKLLDCLTAVWGQTPVRHLYFNYSTINKVVFNFVCSFFIFILYLLPAD
jgi:hypothetical protein